MIVILNFIIVLCSVIAISKFGKMFFKKFFNIDSSFNFPFGFIVFIVIFEIISFIPIYHLWSFNFVKFILVPLYFVFITYFMIQFIMQDLKSFSSRYEDKYVLLVDVLTLVLCLYFFVYSRSLYDSRLYVRMGSIGSYSDYIYSFDGITRIKGLTFTHAAESYPLFQNLLVYVSRMNPYLYLSSFMKIFEIVFLVQIVGWFSKVVFVKNKYFGLLCILSGLFLANSFLAVDNQNIQILFLAKMNATGTILLIISSFCNFVFYIKFRDKIKNSNLFLLIIYLFYFSISSTALYIVISQLLVLIMYDLIVEKTTKFYNDYLLAIHIPLFFLFVYINIVFFPNIILYIPVLLILFASAYLCYKFKLGKNLGYMTFFLYVLFLIYLLNTNDLNFMYLNRFLDFEYFVIFILGFCYMYKTDSKLAKISLLSILVIGNPIFRNVYELYVGGTFNRIEAGVAINLACIFSIFLLFSLIKNLNIKIFLVLGIVFSSFITMSSSEYLNLEKFRIKDLLSYNSFLEYKVRDIDTFKFASYEGFKIGDSIYFEKGTPEEQIFIMVPYLYLEEKDDGFDYMILSKEQAKNKKNYEVVVEGQNKDLLKKINP